MDNVKTFFLFFFYVAIVLGGLRGEINANKGMTIVLLRRYI